MVKVIWFLYRRKRAGDNFILAFFKRAMGALMFIEKRLIPNVFSHIVIRDRAQQPAFKRH